MEAFEIPAMIVALVMLFLAVGAKVITTQVIDRMSNQISFVEQDKREALGRLNAAQNQKSVAEQNLRLLKTKKKKMSRKLTRLKREEEQFVEDENARKQRNAMRKIQ